MKFAPGLLTIVSLWFLTGCGSSRPDFSEIARTNPDWLIMHEDSLVAASSGSEALLAALLDAHAEQAQAAYAAGNWAAAADHYGQVLSRSPRNVQGRFGLAMSEGRLYFKKGGPNDLWEAIVKFGEAAVIDTASGIPHYWLGKAYEKKDKDDFDLIIEAYDQALAKQLPDSMIKFAEEERAVVVHRKEVYEAFWH